MKCQRAGYEYTAKTSQVREKELPGINRKQNKDMKPEGEYFGVLKKQ